MFRKLVFAAAVAATTFSFSHIASAAAVRAGFNADTFASNDDGSLGPVSLGFTLDFFGEVTNDIFINNNGNITLDGAGMSTFTPFDLTSTNRHIIAPFFADVDTRGSNPVTFGAGTVGGRDAFGVNWLDVGHFSSSPGGNFFQLLLVDRSDTGAGNFDFEFNYDSITWETGNASGGSGGLGGNSARVGFSNGSGDAGTFLELDGSAINGALLDGGVNALISGSRNSNVDGRYIFEVRNGLVEDEVSTVPVPAALPLMMTGLAGLGLMGWRKRKET